MSQGLPKNEIEELSSIDHTKDRISKAALDIFAKRGFASTTTRMIAKKARLNVSLISRYFGSKEGLFWFIIEHELGKLIKKELPYPPMPSLEDELRHYMKSLLSDVVANRRFFRIVIAHSFIDSKIVRKIKETILTEGDVRLRERLAELQKKKALKIGSIEDLDLSITAFLRGVAIYEILLEEEPNKNLNEHIERFLRLWISPRST